MASRTFINSVKHNSLFYSLYFYIGSFFVRFLKIFLRPAPKLIVFSCSSGKSFSDSPKAIYDAMIKDHRFDDCEIVWDFRNPEKYEIPRGRKIKTDTMGYYVTILKARVWITNVSLSRGLDFSGIHTFVFNTWHGSAIKKIGIDVKTGGGTFASKSSKKRGDVILGQGSYDVERFSHAYEIQEKDVLPIGLPRNDELVYNNKENVINSLKNKLGIPSDKKVILYAPTYRDYLKDDKMNSIFDMPFHVDKWEEKLGKEYVLLFRAHPEIIKVTNLGTGTFVKDVSNYNSINELMLVSDILISDYSSIFFDYSILRRPMLCYAYDYDEYNDKRGVYFDIRKELSSEDLCNEETLINSILNIDYTERIRVTENFRNKYVQEYGNASRQSLDFIYDVLSN